MHVYIRTCIYIYKYLYACINTHIYNTYVYRYTYILNNDSAGAYQHYSSYKEEGHDVYGKGNRLAK